MQREHDSQMAWAIEAALDLEARLETLDLKFTFLEEDPEMPALVQGKWSVRRWPHRLDRLGAARFRLWDRDGVLTWITRAIEALSRKDDDGPHRMALNHGARPPYHKPTFQPALHRPAGSFD